MIHLQVAEAGRRQGARGRHGAALDHYREALRRALNEHASPVFLHHYTECILDALEASGDAAQALVLTEHALEASAPARASGGALCARLHAGLAERRIVLLFVCGRAACGDAALARDADLGGSVLAAFRDARRRRLTITPAWLAGLRRRAPSADLRMDDALAGEHIFERETTGG